MTTDEQSAPESGRQLPAAKQTSLELYVTAGGGAAGQGEGYIALNFIDEAFGRNGPTAPIAT